MVEPATIPVERLRRVARDEDEAADILRTMYSNAVTGVRSPAGATEYSFSSAVAGRVRCDHVRNTFPFRTTFDPFEQLVFFCFRIGAARVGDGGSEQVFGLGDHALYRRDAAQHVDTAAFDVRLLVLPWDAVSVAAGHRTGLPARGLRFTSMRPVSSAMAAYWTRITTLIHDDFAADDPSAANPLINEHLLQTAATAALMVFPNPTMTAEHLRGPGWTAPASLRRAVAFIEAHAHEPVTLTEIAAAAGTSGRAVQHAFGRHFDITPTGYLRRIRLRRAHEDLLAADPTTGATVAEIAARWGFAKPGNFAVAYRKAYGVPPSHTLRS
ncbi:helix-turn-helix transcriptional regulator [Lentzea albida]|uniref:AraC-type DNA-binding protein n=1 Tax=Lentzea albida TaxID=65499 RepID=A0A1H9WHQ0_9PSEU|nr:helix-turn-helix transcriptional regulator [Lentzea albida]SES32983.1 AraC-type DNA-binding protein [Lentzea albida]